MPWTWSELHERSQFYANHAEFCTDPHVQKEFYKTAAQYEHGALDILNPRQQRTIRITLESAIALYEKAGTEVPNKLKERLAALPDKDLTSSSDEDDPTTLPVECKD